MIYRTRLKYKKDKMAYKSDKTSLFFVWYISCK